MRLSSFVRVVAVCAFIVLGSANAAYVATFEQVGSNVVETGTGSLNLAGLTGPAALGVYNFETPLILGASGVGIINFLGAAAHSDIYAFTPIGPATTFATPPTYAGSAAGAIVGISSFSTGTAQIYVPVGYTSGADLGTSTATYVDETLSALLLVPGTYEYFLTALGSANGGVIDTFTIQVGPAAEVAVPEPESIALLGLGIAAIGVARRKRINPCVVT